MEEELFDILKDLYDVQVRLSKYLHVELDLLKGIEEKMTKENMDTIKSYYYTAYRQYWGIFS